MDNDVESEKLRLEEESALVERFFSSPAFVAVDEEWKNGEKSLMDLILNVDVTSTEQLYSHFTAIGHLRGIRAARQSLESMAPTLRKALREICH